MKKVGVVLSGAGYLDGAEIQEAVLTMLALDRAGAEMVYLAPDMEQLHVVNHQTGNEMENESRNVLVEAARITRGQVRDILTVTHEELDALILPGGFGVAKNLCDYAMSGTECTVHPAVETLVADMHRNNKPIGAMCIAPAMMAKIVENMDKSADLTIGYDENTADDIEVMGSSHIKCPVGKAVTDKKMKIVSTPAYMEAKSISQAAKGIEALVKTVLSMVKD